MAQVDGSGTAEGKVPMTSNTGVAASGPRGIQPKPMSAIPPTTGFAHLFDRDRIEIAEKRFSRPAYLR